MPEPTTEHPLQLVPPIVRASPFSQVALGLCTAVPHLTVDRNFELRPQVAPYTGGRDEASKSMKRDELRQLLLDTGVEVLLEEGLSFGFDHLTFPRVFERVERLTGRRLTRAAVYDRLWPNQAAWQWDVLVRVIDESAVVDDRTRVRIDQILDSADVSTEAGRLRGLHNLCEVAAQQHVIDASHRQHQRIAIAAIGAFASAFDNDPVTDGEEAAREALRRRVERETADYVDIYNQIGSRLGFRMRDPLELRHLVMTVTALGEGLAARLNFAPDYATPIAVPTQQAIQNASYSSLAALGVEAIALSMLELDPDWVAPD